MKMRGFALLESLIALALFAFSGLTVLWSHQQALQQQRQQIVQASAMNLAQDLSERMFVNPHPTALYARDWSAATPLSATDCTQFACATTDLAIWDMQQWLAQVKKQLPQGDARVESLSGTPNFWSVTLAWQDHTAWPFANDIAHCPQGMRCWQLVFSVER